jgi:hypothetical protein
MPLYNPHPEIKNFTPLTGVYYYCYEAVKAAFEKAKGKGTPMTTPQSMAAGAIAGAAVVLATNPIWTVNVKDHTVWTAYILIIALTKSCVFI